MISDFDKSCIKQAFEVAKNSPAVKRKVGAIISTKTNNILSTGFNGNINNLKLDIETSDGKETHDSVAHAEESAIMYLLTNYHYKSLHQLDLTLYCTYTPCMNCCRLIVQAGIKRLVYANEHKTNFTTPTFEGGVSPKQFLEMNGVIVERCSDEKEVIEIPENKPEPDTSYKVMVVYHSKDVDGMFSGYLMKKYLELVFNKGMNYKYPKVKHYFVGWDYEEKLPWVENTYPTINEYFFVDITPPIKWLEDIKKQIIDNSVKIHILDHHKYKVHALSESLPISIYTKLYIHFNNSKSGAGIVWDYIRLEDAHNAISMLNNAQYVSMIQDYDLFLFNKPGYDPKRKIEVLGLNLRLSSFKNFDDFCDQINMVSIDKHIELGQGLIESVKGNNKALIEKGKYIGMYNMFIFNGYPNYWIEEQIAKHLGFNPDIWVGFELDFKNNIAKFSLRSNPNFADIDVGKIAMKFQNGGGHKNAAGFRVKIADGINLVNNPELIF